MTRPLKLVAWALFASVLLLPARAPAQLALPTDPPETQPAAPEPAADTALQSPQATMRTFLGAMSAWKTDGLERDLLNAVRCLDLTGVFSADEIGPRLARRVYTTLIDLELGLDPIFQFTTLPDSFPSRDTLVAGIDRFVVNLTPLTGGTPVPLLFRTNADGDWLIDRTTIKSLDQRYSELYPNPLERLATDWGMDWMVSGSLLGMAYYRWIAIFLVICIGVVIDFIVREIARRITRKLMHKRNPNTDLKDQNKSARKPAKPVGMAAGGLSVYFMLDFLDLPVIAEGILRTGAKAFAMAALIWSAYRLVDVVADHMMHLAKQTTSAMDDLMVPLIRTAVKIFIVAFGLLFIAESFSLPIASLVAGLGIGGLAFAFAAKDTIENLFGSVAVILDQPFAPGDWVVVEGVEGTIEELGFRSTRIRTFYNSLVTIPNSTLVRAKVDNYGKRRYRRFKTHLSLTYSTDPARIEQFCEGVRELIRQHPHSRKDYYEVHLHQFSAASLDVLVYMFFRTPDWSAELAARHRFMLDVIRLAQKIGVDFAFPTQTLHIFNETDTPPTTPSDIPLHNASSLKEQGSKAAQEITGV